MNLGKVDSTRESPQSTNTHVDKVITTVGSQVNTTKPPSSTNCHVRFGVNFVMSTSANENTIDTLKYRGL